MGYVIVQMPKREDSLKMADLIRSHLECDGVEVTHGVSDLIRVAMEHESGIVLSAPALPGMRYDELLDYLPPSFHMLVMTRDTTLEVINERVNFINLPFRPSELIHTLFSILLSIDGGKRRRVSGMKRNNDEEKIVSEAKSLLMRVRNISEEEAFRYIQKRSMDTGRTMARTSQLIILVNK